VSEADVPEVGRSASWSFGSGGIASGVILNANYFILIYYNQVLDLSGSLAGLALATGLAFDAVSDPLTGFLSDNWNSRWGRRHPFLYASVLPVSLFYFLLWHPPAAVQGDLALFFYLLVCNTGVKLGLTLFVIPAFAMVPELAPSYEDRTRLLTYMGSVASIVGNGMSVLMYALWLVETPDVADGVLNAAGYREAGLYGTLAIALSILIFAIGLHRFIPRMRRYTNTTALAPRDFLQQVRDVLRNPSLRTLIAAGLLYASASGTYAALWAYIYSFFWEFSSAEISLLVVPMVLGGAALIPVLPRLSKGREKRSLAIAVFLAAGLVSVLPIVLRLAGLFPANGTAILFWIMMVAGFFETILFLMLDTTWSSMVADVVEHTALATGRRNEGIILSTLSFTAKCATALGTTIAGVVLDLISFPKDAAVGDVDPQTIFELGLAYGPLILSMYLLGTFFISRYRITRADQEAAIERLRGS
jgi:GPH family glycoside/pentoside/hexuronide:cation symporter